MGSTKAKTLGGTVSGEDCAVDKVLECFLEDEDRPSSLLKSDNSVRSLLSRNASRRCNRPSMRSIYLGSFFGRRFRCRRLKVQGTLFFKQFWHGFPLHLTCGQTQLRIQISYLFPPAVVARPYWSLLLWRIFKGRLIFFG
jgi:hypothetical protein